MNMKLSKNVRLDVTEDHVHIALENECKVLSSAVLNGGVVSSKHILNMKVSKHGRYDCSPAESLASYCADRAWEGGAVGVMTAASMKSFRIEQEQVQGIDIALAVTSGLENARRVGDHAEYRTMLSEPKETGTINIIMYTSAVLSEATMAEAFMLITEAKTAALYDTNIQSPVSSLNATGTGTDSVIVVSEKDGPNVNYAGKHVLFGEIIGRLAYRAIMSSIEWDGN